MQAQKVGSSSWLARKNKETYPGSSLSKQSKYHMVSYSRQTILYIELRMHSQCTRPFSSRWEGPGYKARAG